MLEYESNRLLKDFVAKANFFYRNNKALWVKDHSWAGFEWLDTSDRENSVFIFQRIGETKFDKVIIALNMVPVPLKKYRIPVDEPGEYSISLNSDDMKYGGSGYPTGAEERGIFLTNEEPWKGRPYYIEVCLPPLSGMYIEKISILGK